MLYRASSLPYRPHLVMSADALQKLLATHEGGGVNGVAGGRGGGACNCEYGVMFCMAPPLCCMGQPPPPPKAQGTINCCPQATLPIHGLASLFVGLW